MSYINVSNTHAKYTGKFSGEVSTMIHDDGNTTNLQHRMLDIEKSGMDKKQLKDNLRLLLNKFNGDISKLSEHTNIPVYQINELLSDTGSSPDTNDSRCTENIQIGDKLEMNFQGDGHTNNFSGMLHDSQKDVIIKLKDKVSSLEKLIKEKEATIDALKETIELFKNKST